MATNNSSNLSSPVSVGQGGTGDTTFTAYALVCGGTTTTAPLQSIASVGTAGQVLTSNGASALPTFQASAGAVAWTAAAASTQAMVAGTGYYQTYVGTVAYTLPSTAAAGTEMWVVGSSAHGWTLAQNASQSITFGNVVTTPGTGGSLASSADGDVVHLLCTVANTTWVVLDSMGNLTYV